jgi:catalase
VEENPHDRQGVTVTDNRNSLMAGQRSPVLIKDVHIIEKQEITL